MILATRTFDLKTSHTSHGRYSAPLQTRCTGTDSRSTMPMRAPTKTAMVQLKSPNPMKSGSKWAERGSQRANRIPHSQRTRFK